MSGETVDGVFTIALDPLSTTATAAIFFVVGVVLKRRIGFLTRFCVPTALIGGLFVAFFTLTMRRCQGVSILFSTALQAPMILAFFTTMGIGGSLSLLARGGWVMVIYFAVCCGVAILQNVLGVGMAKLLGLHSILGVMAGAVSLKGGHEAAAVFGPAAESLGVSGAQAVAISSATYGLIAGGLLGGPLISWLIERNKLEPATSQEDIYKRQGEGTTLIDGFDFFQMLALVLVIMAVGRQVSLWINEQAKSVWQWENFFLPDYVGAMFVGAVFRNLNDVLKIVKLHSRAIELISKAATGIFLTVAAMSLRIWDLYGLAVPLTVILLLQTAVVAFLAIFLLFPILGKDYDAAVMCAGFIGHSLGATPNAVSNINAVCERWGVVSYKALLIVPVCSAVLVDLVSIPNILWFIHYFTH
ncbi:MAG: sodium:glutamate symporter [Synergistaceae bacterium]|jgi:ESS family glutamate:Na+ symporter|nr:sodium:glutamate symporter [Synergistaceae bacterium]